MTVYLVAQLAFTNVEAYRRYQAKFMDVFRKFDGRLLAADEHPKIGEGHWGKDKIVIMSFPDEGACLRFANSAEYQEISKDRRAGADTVSLIVKGIPAVT
jgi:uncharacterized protein (DUF1330 family)